MSILIFKLIIMIFFSCVVKKALSWSLPSWRCCRWRWRMWTGPDIWWWRPAQTAPETSQKYLKQTHNTLLTNRSEQNRILSSSRILKNLKGMLGGSHNQLPRKHNKTTLEQTLQIMYSQDSHAFAHLKCFERFSSVNEF